MSFREYLELDKKFKFNSSNLEVYALQKRLQT
jgi:hypothetical protein